MAVSERSPHRMSSLRVLPTLRRGSILVVAAGGLIALLTFAAFAVDVGFMHLNRAKVNAMTRAAANAGYEKLKEVSFDYDGNQSAVDTVIRSYLTLNGASTEEADAATISVGRRGSVTVTMTRNSPIFFGAVAGLHSVGVAGEGEIQANNLGPYGVPTTYQDPDRDGVANWSSVDESITTTVNPWAWKADRPYIIKFGSDDDTFGTSENYVFIPMERVAKNVTLPSSALFTLPAQSTSGSMTKSSGLTKAARDAAAGSNIGFFRAYGIAYDVLGLSGVSEAPVFWLLGYSGGSFFVSETALTAAGYTLSSLTGLTNNSRQVDILKGGVSTGVVAVALKVKSGDPDYSAFDVEFIQKIDALAKLDPAPIKMLKITHQPKIMTFTEEGDPVTDVMYAAGISYTAFNLVGETTAFHSFNVDPLNETAAQILAKFDANGPFDWLHLHHENFVEGISTGYDKLPLVDAIQQFVRNEQKFMFTACEATETLDIALARLGSTGWTASGATPSAHGGTIQYDKTFAFTDFYVSSKSPFQGSDPDYDKAEIDTETKVNYYLVDYLNPLTQSHVGFGGLQYDETTDTVVTTLDTTDYVIGGGGSTTTFRHAGDGHSTHEIVKPHEQAANGITVPQYVSSGGVAPGDSSKTVIVLGQQTGGAPGTHNTSLSLRYLSGTGDTDTNLENGFGRWSYLAGHEPNMGNGDIEITATEYEYEDAKENNSTTYEDKDPSNKSRWLVEAKVGYDLNGDGDTSDSIPLRTLGSTKCPTGTAGAGTSILSWDSSKNRAKFLNVDCDATSIDGQTYDDVILMEGKSKNYGLVGARMYLNNILFGSTAGLTPGGAFVAGTGAINPAGLASGTGSGQYGALSYTSNSYGTTFKLGSKGIGLPIGAQFDTAPGVYQTQTQSAFDYMFMDSAGTTRVSSTWNQYLSIPADKRTTHPQLVTVAVIERIPVAATTPTPEDKLDDYMPGGSPADSANAPGTGARDKSIYAGDLGLPSEDPGQARAVHVIGFHEFFLIDPQNQDPDTQDSGNNTHFVASSWRSGEVRGYYTRTIIAPNSALIYPTSPTTDPR